MDKESRSTGASSKLIQEIAGGKITADSRPTGEGSELFSVNDKGEYCFGSSCFEIRVKPGDGEVRVIVDRNECGADAQQMVDALFGEVIKGAATVYESKSIPVTTHTKYPGKPGTTQVEHLPKPK
jgi:hypothetical protein